MSHDPKVPITEAGKEVVLITAKTIAKEQLVTDRVEYVRNALQKTVAQDKVQFLPRFGEFLGGTTFDTVTGQYAEPTAERKNEIEKRIGELGELMADADYGWWLDGAINISLYRKDGGFIRDHKDVDMSVSCDDLSALEKMLHSKGYVIAYTDRSKYTEDKRCLEIVSADEIKERNLGELQIVRIDNNGKINGNFDQINFIDLHVLRRGADGSVTIPYSGVTFPKEYFEVDRTYVAKNGRSLNLSHPAIVVYHKIESGRDYDFSDITMMKDLLNDSDVQMLEDVFRTEPARLLERHTPSIKKAFEQIISEMSDDDIISALERTRISRDPDAALFIKNFPKFLREHAEMTTDDFVQTLFTESRIIEKLGKQAQIKIDKMRTALGR